MKKKILYYSDCYIFGGCENILVNLINEPNVNEKYIIHYAYARNRDYQSGVDKRLGGIENKYPLSILSNGNLFYRINKTGIYKFVALFLKLPFFICEKVGIYSVFNILRLYFLFNKIKPDILHINNGGYPGARSCQNAVIAAKLAGVKKIIFNVNNIALSQKNVIEKIVDRFIDKYVDQFITASDQARLVLIEKRRFGQGKVLQIYNSMQPEKVVKDRKELLQKYDIAVGKYIITNVAFLTERKGQIFLLKALQKLKQADKAVYDNLFVFFVGDGEDRIALETFIQEHELEDKVCITGYCSDYYDYINASDLFILPSIRDEDMPLVILSAMSLGKPIISTRVAGITEEIRDGVDGILLDPKELETLSETIKRLYQHKDLSKSFGASAQKRYFDVFTLDKMIGKYMNLYTGLLEKGV